MLHDIGLTADYDRGGCFESDGAEVAREVLARVGWDDARAETVADAIYLHMHEVEEHHSAEAHLLAFGTTVDVSGGRYEEIDAATRDIVVDEFPRHDFKREFLALFTKQGEAKPNCIVHRLMADGFATRILSSPYAE
jgi:hypothetical protein